jgi:hypothetical protein
MVAYHLFMHTNLGGSCWRRHCRWCPMVARRLGDSPWMIMAALTWLAVLAGTMAVRWFLLEFVGDAAIYVSSHKMNRFYETRQAIKEGSAAVARAVYQFGRCRRHFSAIRSDRSSPTTR